MDEARFVGDALGDTPSHAGVGHQTVRGSFEGDELSFAETGLDEDMPIRDERACAGAVLCSFFEAPELFAGCGFVAVVGFGSARDEDGFSVERRDERCGEALAVITVSGGFAIPVEIFVINGAICFPNGSPGFPIERGDELEVAAIEVHDEKVIPKDRAGASTSEVIANKVSPLPEDVAGTRVKRRRSGGTEGNIDHAIRGHGGGGGIAVELVAELRCVDREQNLIEHDFSGVFLKSEDGELGAVFGCGGQPDAVSDDDGGGPTFAVDGRLPFDVLIFAERGGDVFGPWCCPVGVGAAELCPVGGEEGRGEGDERGGEVGVAKDRGEHGEWVRAG